MRLPIQVSHHEEVCSRHWEEARATLTEHTAIIKKMIEVEILILRSIEGVDEMGWIPAIVLA